MPCTRSRAHGGCRSLSDPRPGLHALLEEVRHVLGSSQCSEYWWFALIGLVAGIATTLIDVVAAGSFAGANANTTGLGDILSYGWALATLVSSLALGVRRLHDTNRSGWWLLIALVPLVGAIVLVLFYASGPNAAGARFGRAGTPKYGAYAGQPQA